MSNGVPSRSFNMQLVPNYAAPLDARSVGASASDRPTVLLYDGLLRYEIESGQFVYAKKVNNVWTWQPLLFLDTFAAPVTFTNQSGLSNVMSVTDAGVSIAGTLQVGGVSIIPNPTASNVTYNSTSLQTTLDNMNNRLNALEGRRSTVLDVTNLPERSDFRVNLPSEAEVLTLAFSNNPLNYQVTNGIVSIPTAGTYRFRFTALSTANNGGHNDAFVCFLFTSQPTSVTPGWGYNEWNGGNYTRHQAPVVIDRVVTFSTNFTVWVELWGLDGLMLWGRLVIERIN